MSSGSASRRKLSGCGKRGKDQFAEETFAQAARHVALNLRPHRLNQLVVLNARRAGRHAGHAAQALIHVQPEAVIERRLAVRGFLDHVNAPARRVHFLAPEHVSGTCGQAKATVHAVVDVLLLRRVDARQNSKGAASFCSIVCGIGVRYLADKSAGIQNAVGVEAAFDLAHQWQRV